MGVVVTLPESSSYTKEEFRDRQLWLAKRSGVYVLRNTANECLYVGKSTDIWQRINSHLRGDGSSLRFYKQIETITLYFSMSQFEVEVYETYLINELMPLFNIDKMFFPEHVERLSESLMSLDEEMHELEEERRALIYEIEDFDSFECDEYHDERVIRFEQAANASRLRVLDREIQSLAEQRWRLRSQLTVSGGAS